MSADRGSSRNASETRREGGGLPRPARRPDRGACRARSRATGRCCSGSSARACAAPTRPSGRGARRRFRSTGAIPSPVTRAPWSSGTSSSARWSSRGSGSDDADRHAGRQRCGGLLRLLRPLPAGAHEPLPLLLHTRAEHRRRHGRVRRRARVDARGGSGRAVARRRRPRAAAGGRPARRPACRCEGRRPGGAHRRRRHRHLRAHRAALAGRRRPHGGRLRRPAARASRAAGRDPVRRGGPGRAGQGPGRRRGAGRRRRHRGERRPWPARRRSRPDPARWHGPPGRLPAQPQEIDVWSLVMQEKTVQTTLAHVCGEDLAPALDLLATTHAGRRAPRGRAPPRGDRASSSTGWPRGRSRARSSSIRV